MFILVALFTAFCVVYGVWVQFPSLQNEALIKECQSLGDERFASLQAVANDPAQNGFLSETFRPYWDFRDKGYVEDNEVRDVMSAWYESYATPGKGEVVDHKALQDSKDTLYLKARSDFEKLIPELTQEIRKPCFVVPMEKIDINERTPDMLALRGIAQALAGYADSQVAEGELAEAIETLSTILALGNSTSGQGFIVADLIAASILTLAYDASLTDFPPSSELDAEQWKNLSQTFLTSLPPEDQLYQLLQSEVWLFRKDFNGDTLGGVTRLPGFLAREQRIFENKMCEILTAVKLDDPDALIIETPGLGSLLTGKSGLIASMLFPSYSRAGAKLTLTRKKLLSRGICAALLSYRKSKGTWPSELANLSEIGLDLPFEATPAWLEYKLEGDKALLTTSLSAAENEGHHSRDNSYPESPWARQDKEGSKWVYEL